ncbi:cobalamin biosynthesis protein CobG [Streptomyces sp. SP17BM10]|uniref:cobalamin biosynthesis protein CobG n=1 Tax=Streptomyces sp. SP17BM10 TaxID=3002530 RepID=UPI002E76C8E2|nr:cobalamin biosynthesis protein CobG [Streptomyces sp. SP17BM10]MEE1787348.1 cobalamin biosynthesis protein CobG [Streptomyces sp. SP17BM10]
MPPTPDATAPGAAVPDRGRADACPGALRLHTADDGALARVRLPGGLLTDRQALALADAAEALGDGELETTSRGNVQLRGLASHCAADLADRLRAVGLLPSDTHERVRNVVASPLAGLDAHPAADVQAWVRELDARLCASDWAAGLSGKFLFALDDGCGDVAALDADVTLIAGPDGTHLLRLGRDAAGHPVEAGREVTAVLDAARSFLDALRADGRKAWHLRDVPDLLPAGTVPLPAFTGAAPAVGALPGGLSVGLRFGRASAAQWRALVAACAGELRLTPWRGAVLPGAPAGRLAGLAEAGFRTLPGSPWERASACTGLPGCAKSHADVRADAARALDSAAAGGLPVHWSGCERRCGHPAGRWVDVLATGQGYRVTVNGPGAGAAGPDGAVGASGAAGQASVTAASVMEAPVMEAFAMEVSAVDVTNEEMAEAVAEARRTTK